MAMTITAMNTRLWERKSNGRNEILNIISMNECHYIYIFTEYKIFIKLVSKSSLYKWHSFIEMMFKISFLPLLFLSQSLVFIAVIVIIIIFWLLVSSSFSFHSWCYWIFFWYNKLLLTISYIYKGLN